MALPNLPVDKANHLFYGAVIFNVVFIVATLAHLAMAWKIALGVVAFCAVAKEALDAYENYKATGNPRQGPHGVEGLDALATFVGGLLCALPLIVSR